MQHVVSGSFATNTCIASDTDDKLLIGVNKDYPNTSIGFVHIDDVVAAHLLAMEKKEASGRLICSTSVAHWSEIIKLLKAKYPSYPIVDK